MIFSLLKVVIAIAGGGSVIDVTQKKPSVCLLSVNGGLVEEYQMNGKQVTTAPPLFIAIPTTSGTGAEATKTAVVFNNYNGLKKSLYHTTMIADIVILDPTFNYCCTSKKNHSRYRYGCTQPCN